MDRRIAAVLREHLPVVLSTACPGVQRVVQLLVVQWLYGISELGRFSNDLAIVMLLGYFSATGWSMLMLVRVPASAQDRRAALALGLGRLAAYSTAALALAVLALAQAGLVLQAVPSIALLAGWSAYQMFRHYCLAIMNYTLILAAEAALLAATVSALFAFSGHGAHAVYYAIAVPAIALGLVGGARLALRRQPAREDALRAAPGTVKTGIEFGAVNLVSGGIHQLVIPVTLWLAGEAYAGLLSLLLSLVSLLLLFPRALSFRNLPHIAVAARAGDDGSVIRIVRRFRIQLALLTGLVAAACALAWLLLAPALMGASWAMAGAATAFALLLANFVVSQLVLPEANYLQAMERTALQIRINTLSLLLFAGACAALVAAAPAPATAVVLMLAALLLTTVLRSAQLVCAVHRDLPALYRHAA